VALVANSVAWIEEGGTWKPAPDNKLFVIDLQASPPKLVETVTVGQQPSGMAIISGDARADCQPADSSVTVATLTGTQVKVINTITFPAETSRRGGHNPGCQTRAGSPVQGSQARRPGY